METTFPKKHKELMELNKKKHIAITWINNNITCDEVTFSEAFSRLKEIYKEIRKIKLEQKGKEDKVVQQALKVFDGKVVDKSIDKDNK